MDEHIQYHETLCRLCGTNLPRTRVSVANKETFKLQAISLSQEKITDSQFWIFLGI